MILHALVNFHPIDGGCINVNVHNSEREGDSTYIQAAESVKLKLQSGKVAS